MQNPPGESFGYSASIACQVDSYMSPSRRMTASCSIGAVGQRVLEPADEELDLLVEQPVALEVVLDLLDAARAAAR